MNAIGVFDSGLGGLTVLKQLQDQLPGENYIYLGDNARVPYGNKSEQTVIHYSNQAANFLKSKNVKMIVVACNTASATSLKFLKEKFSDIPVIGMIDPAVEAARKISKNYVGVIGTESTIDSKSYSKRLSEYELKINETACPLFVPIVESGVGNFKEAAKLIAEKYLSHFKENTPDSLILACTHYPFLQDLIKSILPDTQIIDTGEYAAKFIKEHFDFEQKNLTGTTEFYVTDKPNKFIKIAKSDLGMDINQISLVDLEKFN